MKIKIKLLAITQVALMAIGAGYSNISFATACAANTSPTADCTNLTISSGNFTISKTVSDTSGTAPAILNSGSVGSVEITGSGLVTSGTNLTPVSIAVGLYNNGTISSINNMGLISAYGSTSGYGIENTGTTSSIFNSGTISGTTYAIYNSASRTIGSIVNSGTISGTTSAIENGALGNIGSIINTGSIYGPTSYAINNNSGATITEITNLAKIGSTTSGIYGVGRADISNAGTITTLNNAQNALYFTGVLPRHYNIIINSASSYGILANAPVAFLSGSTSFGIYSGTAVTTASYAGVVNGLSLAQLGSATTGKYQGMTWTLTNSGSDVWNLSFSGTNTAVMSALNQTTTALQNAFTLQNTVLVNGFTYDCPVFDKNNVCVSVGARTTAVNTDSVNSTGGLLIGAYRLNNQVRMGAYIDQNISTNSTGIVKVSNASPMVGVFGVWNERQDGTGTEVKVSAGYGQKNTTMTRPIVDGAEAGSGSSTLTSQGVQAIGKYGFAVADKTIVSPYVGLRYTQNNMGGFTEGSSASVTAPLTYSAVNTNATTVVAGLGANYKIMPDVTLLASAGLENDLSTSNGTYSATGLYGINPISFNSNPVRTRATASAGAYYDLAKNQRVSLNYIFRQEQFQGVNTNAAFLTYAIGL